MKKSAHNTMQHWIGVRRRWGCFNDLCQWLHIDDLKVSYIFENKKKLRNINFQKSLKIKSYVEAYLAYAIPTDIFTEHALLKSIPRLLCVNDNILASRSALPHMCFQSIFFGEKAHLNRASLTLVKMVPGSWRDLGKIPPRFPPGSRRDFGRRESCRDSWREAGFPAAKISAGSRRESYRDSWREAGFPAAKISAGSRRESYRDSWREAGFPAAKISAGSRRESCRDSWRETGFPAAKISSGSRRESCRDSWREAGSRRPKSRRDSGGSLAGILGGRRDSQRPKSRQDPGGSLAGILGG